MLDVAIGDVAHQAGRIAHADLRERVVLQKLGSGVDFDDFGFCGSTHHVVAGVDEDDIAGHGARGLAAQQGGDGADIGDGDALMFWRP